MNIFWITVTFLLLVVLVQSQPQYEVQLRETITFSYKSGFENQLASGNCCSISETNTPPCQQSCDNSVLLCFREVEHSETDNDLQNCPLGSMTINLPAMETNVITLNATTVRLTTTTTYPGSFQLYYRIVVVPGRREVESVQQTFNTPIQAWESFNSSAMRHTLQLGALRVVCREGYFGLDCGCSPRNDSIGHYACAANGTIVCLPGYQNPETNCTEEEERTTKEASSTPDTATSNPSMGSTAGSSLPIIPIVAGVSVGGVLVLTVIAIAITLVVFGCKPKRRQPKARTKDAVATTSFRNGAALNDMPGNEDSGTDGGASSLYTQVNKKKNSSYQEEAPPIIPYQGELYSEVERTGLFNGQRENTTTSEDLPQVISKPEATPQLVYADVNGSTTPKAGAQSNTQVADKIYVNIHTTEVEYSTIET